MGGVRTHILICVGSALFMQISRAMPALAAASAQPGVFGDPGRIASQVVVGCGFIGAGTIMRAGFSVPGISVLTGLRIERCKGCYVIAITRGDPVYVLVSKEGVDPLTLLARQTF